MLDRSLHESTVPFIDRLLAPEILLQPHTVFLVRLSVWPLHWISSLTSLRIVVTAIAIRSRRFALHVDGPCDKRP